MGIIRKTATRQTRYTANYGCPYNSELVVSEESVRFSSEDPLKSQSVRVLCALPRRLLAVLSFCLGS